MKKWIENTFGVCFHDWKFIGAIVSAEGHDRYYDKPIPSIILGEKRLCRKCAKIQEIFYPDGH